MSETRVCAYGSTDKLSADLPKIPDDFSYFLLKVINRFRHYERFNCGDDSRTPQGTLLIQLSNAILANKKPLQEIIADWKSQNENNLHVVNKILLHKLNEFTSHPRLANDVFTSKPFYLFTDTQSFHLLRNNCYALRDTNHNLDIYNSDNKQLTQLNHSDVIHLKYFSTNMFVTFSKTTFKIWSAEGYNQLYEFKLPNKCMFDECFSDSQKSLLLGTGYYIVKEKFIDDYDLSETKSYLWTYDLINEKLKFHVIGAAALCQGYDIFFTLDNDQVALSHYNKGIIFYKLSFTTEWQFIFDKHIKAPNDYGGGIMLWPDGKYFRKNENLYKITDDQFEIVKTLEDEKSEYQLIFSQEILPDGSLLYLSGGNLKYLNPYRLNENEILVSTIVDHEWKVRITPDYQLCCYQRPWCDFNIGARSTLEFFEWRKQADYFASATFQYLLKIFNEFDNDLPEELVEVIHDYVPDLYKLFPLKENKCYAKFFQQNNSSSEEKSTPKNVETSHECESHANLPTMF